MNPDDDKKPAKRTFVPAETWVLPARRRADAPADHPDVDDAAKKRPASTASCLDEERVAHPAPAQRHVVLQAGFGLCVSFVLAACGSRDNRQHVGPPLGDTHVSQAPSDPTVPPPDAAVDETPSPGYEITPPRGPSPNQPAPSSSQEPGPQPEPQPGVFSPPPPPTGPADVPQPEIPKP